jgi:hypothetical protein
VGAGAELPGGKLFRGSGIGVSVGAPLDDPGGLIHIGPVPGEVGDAGEIHVPAEGIGPMLPLHGPHGLCPHATGYAHGGQQAP